MEGMRTKGILKSTDSRTWDFGEGVKYQKASKGLECT
jgi:hypothetical protein